MSTTEQQSKASPEVVNMIAFLRGTKSGIKNRTGVLNGKRIDYFKGVYCPPGLDHYVNGL